LAYIYRLDFEDRVFVVAEALVVIYTNLLSTEVKTERVIKGFYFVKG
jgi:hypothetical protein